MKILTRALTVTTWQDYVWGEGGGGGLMYGGSRLVSRSHFLRWERCTHGGSWNRGVSASFYQLLVNWLVRGRAPESLQNCATTSRSPPLPFFLMGHCMDFLLQGDRMGASVPLIGSPMCPHHLVWSGGGAAIFLAKLFKNMQLTLPPPHPPPWPRTKEPAIC